MSLACYFLHAGFLLDLFFHPEHGGNMFLRNTYRFTFNGLHEVISQNMRFFILLIFYFNLLNTYIGIFTEALIVAQVLKI
jgi:hypothetical protein